MLTKKVMCVLYMYIDVANKINIEEAVLLLRSTVA